MVAFTTTADWSWLGTNYIFGSGGTSANFTLHGDDIEMEGFTNARFDAAFGGSGNVNIANSNATHLQLGSGACAVDFTCTTYTQNGSGTFSINASSVTLQTGGVPVFSSDASQNTVINSGSLALSSLPSATTSNILYWNSGTNKVTQGAAPAGGLSWGTVAGTSQAMVKNHGYIPLNAGTTTFSLPVTAAIGDTFSIAGSGSCQWVISENAGQFLQLGNEVTTTTSGTLSSADVNDGVQIVCMVADTKFYVIPFVGANFNLS